MNASLICPPPSSRTAARIHQYQPLTKRGNHELGSNFNDDPHWLILGIGAYIKETGDWGILDELVQFENETGSEQPLYEHLRRSFNYTLERLGPHGLPLIGRADWNDCLNLNCFSDTPGQSFQTTTNKEGKVADPFSSPDCLCSRRKNWRPSRPNAVWPMR